MVAAVATARRMTPMSRSSAMNQATDWDRRFLALAKQVAGWSKAPSSQVGAVAVLDRRILATGFNGFPVGMADDPRLCDRESKYPRIVHAEQNVVAWAAREGVALAGERSTVNHSTPLLTALS